MENPIETESAISLSPLKSPLKQRKESVLSNLEKVSHSRAYSRKISEMDSLINKVKRRKSEIFEFTKIPEEPETELKKPKKGKINVRRFSKQEKLQNFFFSRLSDVLPEFDDDLRWKRQNKRLLNYNAYEHVPSSQVTVSSDRCKPLRPKHRCTPKTNPLKRNASQLPEIRRMQLFGENQVYKQKISSVKAKVKNMNVYEQSVVNFFKKHNIGEKPKITRKANKIAKESNHKQFLSEMRQVKEEMNLEEYQEFLVKH